MGFKRLLENIKFVNRIIKAKLFKFRYPLVVTFLCTYRCNFKCKYCSIFKLEEKEMTTEEIFSMIDQFYKAGTRRFSLNGGEPLLRRDIKEIIDYAKNKGMIISLFTNGSLVKQNIDKIKNVDVLLISFDGPEKIHDKQRFKGAYKKTIEAIKTAKEAGINVWTNTVITKNNLNYIDFIIKKAKKLNFQTIYQPVFHYSHSSKKGDIKKLNPLIEKYQQTIDKLIRHKKQGAPIFNSISYLKYIKIPDWNLNPRKCYASRLYCAVTPSGNVAPCFPIFRSKEWPNGLKLGFKKAFESIPKYNCNGCYCVLVENDFLFKLKPDVILNASKYFN